MSREYCDNCGCRKSGGICSNCQEELFIIENQSDCINFPLSDEFRGKAKKQREEIKRREMVYKCYVKCVMKRLLPDDLEARIEKEIDKMLPNYNFGGGMGGHMDEGREGFIKRLATSIANELRRKR